MKLTALALATAPLKALRNEPMAKKSFDEVFSAWSIRSARTDPKSRA